MNISKKVLLVLPAIALGALLFGGGSTKTFTIELSLTGEETSVSADLWDEKGQSISFYRMKGTGMRSPWTIKTKAKKAMLEIQWRKGSERKELSRELLIKDNSNTVVYLR